MDIEKIRENLLNGTVQGYLTINNVEYVLVNKVHYSEALNIDTLSDIPENCIS